MLDPLVIKVLSLAFAVLLAAAAWHKLSDRVRFRGILSAYQVLPEALVAPAAWFVALVEIALAVAWASGWSLEPAAWATACLLSLYTLAIGVNLLRGRTYIDCGCGFGAHGVQQLSGRLLLRNAVLIALALAAALPPAPRELILVDYAGLAGACLVLALLYAGANQLLLNAQAINSWRKPPAGSDTT